MAFSFKNVQHAVASFFKAIAKDTPLVLAKTVQVIQGVEKDKAQIEAVSAVAAGAIGQATGVGAPVAVATTIKLEDAAFAALASIVTALQAGGSAAEANLLNAGLDQTAIDAAKAAGTASQAVYTLAVAASK
jgi:hypothetical protein